MSSLPSPTSESRLTLATPHAGKVTAVPLLIGAGLLMLALLVGRAIDVAGARQGVLVIIGGAAGWVLYHASFGFGGAWRAFVTRRDGRGLRAQLLMLALTSIVFLPLLEAGEIGARTVTGFASPVGVANLLGAFLFGIGMQLGGGCASGTLYTVGGGSVRMLFTLLFFMVGSVCAALQADSWGEWPTLGPVSLRASLGLGPALLVTSTLLAVLWRLVARLERGSAPDTQARPRPHLLRGHWPLWWGALGLALVNISTLLVAGRPWGVTGAFVLWGSKLAGLVGFSPESWSLWTAPARRAALHGSLLADTTSSMNLGIMAGALLAALLAGRFRPRWRVPWPSLLAAVLGGFLLGYGAKLAHGCNIGAFFSGIASGSLHGWVWFPMAMLGTLVGVRLRPAFRLD